MDKQTTLELFEDIDTMLDENDAVLDEFIIDMKNDTLFDDITINTEDFIIGSETLNIGESDSFNDMEIDMNNEIFTLYIHE